MSTFRVPVVQIQGFGKHPNADTLSITQVEGCPVIFKTGAFQKGDLAVYVPVDGVVPTADHQNSAAFAFLATKEGQTTARIKAKKLRGVFSMGLLLPISEFLFMKYPEVGDDVAGVLGVTKYEEPEPVHMQTEDERDPGFLPVYDMESYRKFKHVLVPGEQVVVTEKVHGCNGRFAYRDGRLWVGSHRKIKKQVENNLWWKIAAEHHLEEKLASKPGIVVYGEVFGQVQDLKYDTKPGELRFAVFDAFDSTAGRWLDHAELTALCADLGLPTVPLLYQGPYEPFAIEPLAEGKSTLANHLREGFVIRPIRERSNNETGRTLLKLVSEAYLLRKDGTEHH